MRFSSFTSEVAIEVAKAYAEGANLTVLSSQYQTSTTTLRNVIVAAGGTIRPRGRVRRVQAQVTPGPAVRVPTEAPAWDDEGGTTDSAWDDVPSPDDEVFSGDEDVRS